MPHFLNDVETNIIYTNHIFNSTDLIFSYGDDQRLVKVGIAMLGNDDTMTHGSIYDTTDHNFGESGRIELCSTSVSTSNNGGGCVSLKNKIVLSRNLDSTVPLWCEIATVDDIPQLRTYIVEEKNTYSETHTTEIDVFENIGELEFQ